MTEARNVFPDLVVEEIDLGEYPTLRHDHPHALTKKIQVTQGDMHGNPLMLVNFLIRRGVIDTSPEYYQKWKDIYLKFSAYINDACELALARCKDPSDFLSFEQLFQELLVKDFDSLRPVLNELDKVLAEIHIIPNKGKILYLGDLVAERGPCDYLSFKILEKLKDARVYHKILISNHDMYLITATELKGYNKYQLVPRSSMRTNANNIKFVISMYGLQMLIDVGVVKKAEVDAIVENIYKPSLQALDYTLSEDGLTITIYSHALIGLDTIMDIAKDINVVYRDDTPFELADTINEINREFSRYVKNKRVNELFYDGGAFIKLIDNRNPYLISRPYYYNHYYICFVHGHDPNIPQEEHVITLDGMLAKTEKNLVGTCSFLHTPYCPVSQFIWDSSFTMFPVVQEKDSNEKEMGRQLQELQQAINRMAFS